MLVYGEDVMVLLENPFASKFFVLVLAGAGCLTNLRHAGTLPQSGVAAVKLSLIAGIPFATCRWARTYCAES